ncbi:MAG: hypothetical protein QOJ40_2943, partial [Verrucomicrobiota bacterium]
MQQQKNFITRRRFLKSGAAFAAVAASAPRLFAEAPATGQSPDPR